MAGKRRPIDSNVKSLVWKHYIGNTMDGICPCCENRKITFSGCHFGHIIPHSQGGSDLPNNLIPLCSKCNTSMKDMNYYQYKERILGGGFPSSSKPKDRSGALVTRKTMTMDGLISKKYRKLE